MFHSVTATFNHFINKFSSSPFTIDGTLAGSMNFFGSLFFRKSLRFLFDSALRINFPEAATYNILHVHMNLFSQLEQVQTGTIEKKSNKEKKRHLIICSNNFKLNKEMKHLTTNIHCVCRIYRTLLKFSLQRYRRQK